MGLEFGGGQASLAAEAAKKIIRREKRAKKSESDYSKWNWIFTLTCAATGLPFCNAGAYL